MALTITKNDINRVYGTPYTPAPKITKSDLDAVYGTPPSYTDIQKNALSRPIKQTKTDTQKYGTVNGKTVLTYSIENQGLYTPPTGEKNNMTALLEGTALSGSNHIKNTANIADTIKTYTTVAGQTYKDTEPLFYDVNKSNQLGDILKSKQQQYGAGSQFRNDIVQKIKDREETQKLWTQQVYDNHKDVKNADKLINLGYGIGNVLPYMAVSALTGSPNLARATMGANIFGASIGESLIEGAMMDQAAGYALSQAGKEMALSKLVGGMPFFKDGLINANAITDKYISNELLKWMINRGVDITGEGVEEAISTYLTPYLKRVFYDPNTPNTTKEQLWNSFKEGMAVSAVLGIANGMGKIMNQSDFNKSDTIYRAYAQEVGRQKYGENEYAYELDDLNKTTDLSTHIGRGQKGDTDGYTVIDDVNSFDYSNKNDIAKTLKKFREDYRNSEVEHSIVISSNGYIYNLTGLGGTVNPELIGIEEIKGSIGMHNHPIIEEYGRGDSFSLDDICFSVRNKTGMEYLITGDKIFAFEYTGNLTEAEMYREYKTAEIDVMSLAFENDYVIEFIQEEIMRLLSERIEGFNYYEIL